MASSREIRRRIKSVKNTQKITKAMEMVSAAKLRRAAQRLEATRPYAKEMLATTSRLLDQVEELNHPLTAVRDVRRLGLMVMASDKGLCGAYNTNVFKFAERYIKTYPAGVEVVIIAVGRRTREYFRRRGYTVLETFANVDQTLREGTIRGMTERVAGFFADGKVDQVDIVYAQYVSAMVNEPTAVQMLPLHPRAEGEHHDTTHTVDFIFEPDPATILEIIVPRYIKMLMVSGLAESFASEHGARMVSMRSATEAAGDMISSLTLTYNRARQAAITKEINEIVGGAEALA